MYHFFVTAFPEAFPNVLLTHLEEGNFAPLSKKALCNAHAICSLESMKMEDDTGQVHEALRMSRLRMRTASYSRYENIGLIQIGRQYRDSTLSNRATRPPNASRSQHKRNNGRQYESTIKCIYEHFYRYISEYLR